MTRRESVSLRVVRTVSLNVEVSRSDRKWNIIPLKGSKLTNLNVSWLGKRRSLQRNCASRETGIDRSSYAYINTSVLSTWRFSSLCGRSSTLVSGSCIDLLGASLRVRRGLCVTSIGDIFSSLCSFGCSLLSIGSLPSTSGIIRGVFSGSLSVASLSVASRLGSSCSFVCGCDIGISCFRDTL
jgi:hypothetical protein